MFERDTADDDIEGDATAARSRRGATHRIQMLAVSPGRAF